MGIERTRQVEADAVAELGEGLADALRSLGDARSAARVLEICGRHTTDPGLAQRRAGEALQSGDAATALEVLVPAWEAGAEDPHLEATLALSALALGLDDIALQLTEPPHASAEHLGVRILLAAAQGEVAEISEANTALVWALRGQLALLVGCGRNDLVWALGAAAPGLGLPGLARMVDGLPGRPPPAATPARPPLGTRDAFTEAWTGPSPDAVYPWAWSVARDVFADEEVLLLGDAPRSFSTPRSPRWPGAPRRGWPRWPGRARCPWLRRASTTSSPRAG